MTERLLIPPVAAEPRRTEGALRTSTAVDVDIVVPVFNEEAALERSIVRLHRYLSTEFPLTWRIVIADNASTDGTAAIASRLALRLRGVRHLRLEQQGRGLALRRAWSQSDAQVVS